MSKKKIVIEIIAGVLAVVLEHGEEIGLGSRAYTIISLDH